MFYYQDQYIMSLRTHGIEVPIRNEKIGNFFKFLKSHVKNSHIKSSYSKLSYNSLKLCHSNCFINALIDNPEQEIIKTFELINDKGEYHRYNPKNAQKPLSNLVDPIFHRAQGTIEACTNAIQTGFSYNLAGGMHHAMKDEGRGFCLINDLVIAARDMQNKNFAKHIWIIDVDAHKGDGTAALTIDDNSISTLSIHMGSGWPLDSNKYDSNGNLNPWFIQSDIDIPIEDYENHLYLKRLEEGLAKLDSEFPKADLAIVVQGSDPYDKDQLESANLLRQNSESMLKRDLMVYNFLKQKNLPQAYVMSGGYGDYAHEPYINFIKSILHEIN